MIYLRPREVRGESRTFVYTNRPDVPSEYFGNYRISPVSRVAQEKAMKNPKGPKTIKL
jgi:hypothetical protein